MNHYDPLPATAKNSEYGARITFFFILPLTHDKHWFGAWTEEKLMKQYKKMVIDTVINVLCTSFI